MQCPTRSQRIGRTLLLIALVAVSALAPALLRQQGNLPNHLAGEDTALFSVDQIKGDVALLIPRSPSASPVLVDRDLVWFAREGDIVRQTEDPALPYAAAPAATAAARAEVTRLLSRLVEKP